MRNAFAMGDKKYRHGVGIEHETDGRKAWEKEIQILLWNCFLFWKKKILQLIGCRLILTGRNSFPVGAALVRMCVITYSIF